MNDSTSMAFVLKGKVDGVEITPRTIGLARFNAFNQQVEQFIAGDNGVETCDIQVEVTEGSYALLSTLTAIALADLAPDLKLMERQDVLGEISAKRAEIIKKWQAASKADENLSYEIRPFDGPTIWISHKSDYRIGEVVPWVHAERYLLGTVLDMGGASKANIHIRLDGSNQIVRIASNQEYLKEHHNNRLYHKVVVRVRAEQHYQTGQMRNLSLIEFIDYQPKYDAGAMAAFVQEGTKAWADVPDPARWVRTVRGG